MIDCAQTLGESLGIWPVKTSQCDHREGTERAEYVDAIEAIDGSQCSGGFIPKAAAGKSRSTLVKNEVLI